MATDIFDEVAEAPARDIFDELDVGPFGGGQHILPVQPPPLGISGLPIAKEVAALPAPAQALPQPPTEPPESSKYQPFGMPIGGQPAIRLPKYETPAMFPGGEAPTSLEVGGGLYNALAGAAESLTTPESAMTMGAAGAPKAIVRLGQGIWAAFMAKNVPEQVQEARKAFKEGRPLSQKVEATIAPIVTTLLAGTAAKEALRPEPLLTPKQIETAQEQARTAGLPSQEPLVQNLQEAKAPLTAAAIEQAGALKPGDVIPGTEAPKTASPAVPTLPTPENAPTAPAQSGKGLPETPVEAVETPESNTPSQMAARAEEALARRVATVPAAQAQAKVSEVARTEGKRSAQEIKDELVQRIQGELDKVVEESGVTLKAIGEDRPDAYWVEDAQGKVLDTVSLQKTETGSYKILQGRKDTETAKTLDDALRIAKENNAFAQGKVTIEIPDDGTFTVYRSGKGLRELKTRASRIKINEKPPGVPRAAIKNSAEAIRRTFTEKVEREAEAERLAQFAPEVQPSESVSTAAAPPVSEPVAIAFPGIGSLREADATPMRLGQIRKSDPELWKAITQRFGSTIPARIATLAKQRFEQQKAAPTPTEPPLGGAMTMGVDPVATARATMRLVNQVRQNETVDRITRQVAGESAPHTMAAAESSGEALIRFASARGTGKLMGRAKATEVLGDKAKDEGFRKKLGAVIVEDQLRATKAKFQEMADKEANPDLKAEYQDMADKAGAAGSPFKSDADFQEALKDPEIQAALKRHIETVQSIAEEAHKMLGGRMMEAGEATGTFANLIAILGPEHESRIFGGGRGDLTNPRKRPSRFFFERKGTASEYETDYQKIASRMVEGNWSEVAKRELYDQLVADGLGVIQPTRPADIGGKPVYPNSFEIQRRGTPGGKTQTEKLWVREGVGRELLQAEDVAGPVARAGWVRAASIANAIQLAGPTDAVFHMANMLSSITRSQGGRNALVDLGRKVPGVNVADTLTRLGVSVFRVVRDSPEIQTRIAELSDIGAMRPLKEYERRQVMSKAIQTLDIAGRLVREDLFNNLVKRGLVEDTPANRREWVNQLGQYNPRLMGQFQRMMRDFGVAPFVVAGRNFNRNAIRSLLLSQGVKAASPRAWAVMKAVDVAGFAMAVFAVPMLLNYWFTGDPKGRPGTKVGEIDTGKGNIKIDPLQWTGLRRGARITGIDAIANGKRWNSSNADIRYAAGRDIVNGILHPWMGPVPKAGAIATTGYGAIGFRESNNPKDWVENLKAAAEQVNPVVKSLITGWEEKAGEPGEQKAAPKIGAAIGKTAKSLAGSMGVKERREVTPLQQIRGIHDDWLKNNPDPAVRADYERNLTEQLPTPKYKAIYDAVQARDKDALKQAFIDLQNTGYKPIDIRKQIAIRYRPYYAGSLEPRPVLHENPRLERQFVASLTAPQRKLYEAARKQRQSDWAWVPELYKP